MTTTFKLSPAALSAIVDIADSLDLDSVCMKVGPEGLTITAVHASRAAMAMASIPLLVAPAETIEEFYPTKQLKLAADALSDLKELEAVWNPPEMKFKSGRRHRTIKSIVPPEGVRPKVPDLPLDVQVMVPAAWFKRCLKGSTGIGYTSVEFKIAEGRISWKNEDELGSYEDEVDVAPDAKEGTWSYSKEFLGKFLSMADMSKPITMNLASEPGYPLVANIPLESGTATALLAPMVATE
jgi:hypothetical protein